MANFDEKTLKTDPSLVRLAGRRCCPFCGTAYEKKAPQKSHIVPNFFRKEGRVTGAPVGPLVDLTCGKPVQNTLRAYMLCSDCELYFSKFEGRLCRSVDKHGMVPFAFRADSATFKASLGILWRAAIVLTEVESAHGKRPVHLRLREHQRALKEFLRDAKLYLKGEYAHFSDEHNVAALVAPSWRKGTAFETVVPFIIQKDTGLLAICVLVGQVVLVVLLARPATWDSWYRRPRSGLEVPPELQAELKRVLDDGMESAFAAYFGLLPNVEEP